jgi:hypothetical protein
MTPEGEARRREQHRRARAYRALAEQIVRALEQLQAFRAPGLSADADAPSGRAEPQQPLRPPRCTFDAQGRVISVTDP